MGKYVTDLPSKNPERSVEKIEGFLRKQGFLKSGRPGKEVWKRTASAILSPEYISFSAGDDYVHLEAWVKAVTPAPARLGRQGGPARRHARRRAVQGAPAQRASTQHRAPGRVVTYSTVTVLARFRG